MASIIINGDDYGLNGHCSRAIAMAFDKGMITDTTVMATGAFFEEAVALAAEKGFFDRIGIHLNLTEGEPLTDGIKRFPIFVTEGRFNKCCDHLRSLTPDELKAAYDELNAQIDRAQAAGIALTHADSHHHIHIDRYLGPTALRVCRERGISRIRLSRIKRNDSDESRREAEEYNRVLRKSGFVTADSFVYAVDVEDCAGLSGCTEILVHPDFDKNGVLIDRRGVRDGYPFGDPLPDFSACGSAELISYRQL